MESDVVILNYLKQKTVQTILNKTPLILTYDKQKELYAFRRMLEIAMKQGIWNGFVGMS